MLHRPAHLPLAGIVLGAILSTSPAIGAPIPLVDPDVTSANAHYSTDQNANISVTYGATDVGSQQGTLTVNTTWGAGDFATRSILFQQTELPAGDYASTQGLRLQLEFSLGNNSGRLWDGFVISMEDNSVPATVGSQATGGTGSHLFKAHFHPNAGGATVAGGLGTISVFNNTVMVELSGGTSSGLLLTNLFLHERNLTDGDADDQPIQRAFTLLLTPDVVPVPTTWLLLLSGLGISGFVRRTRRFRE